MERQTKYFLYLIDTLPGFEERSNKYLVLQTKPPLIEKTSLRCVPTPDTSINLSNLKPGKTYLLEIEEFENGIRVSEHGRYFRMEAFQIEAGTLYLYGFWLKI
jgi:hypothetical protein